MKKLDFINNKKHKDILFKALEDLQSHLFIEIDKIIKSQDNLDLKSIKIQRLSKDLEIKIRATIDKPRKSFNRLLNLIEK